MRQANRGGSNLASLPNLFYGIQVEFGVECSKVSPMPHQHAWMTSISDSISGVLKRMMQCFLGGTEPCTKNNLLAKEKARA